MREYAKVSPRFWTGPTGRRIKKAGKDARILAMYLMTCPQAHMTGLYHLALPTLCHESGLSEDEALAAFSALDDAVFAYYDQEQELVWVVEGARYQIAEELQPKDKRVKAVAAHIREFRRHRFGAAFYKRYAEPFNLPNITFHEAPSEPLGSPLEAPSKPGAGAGAGAEQNRSRKASSAPPKDPGWSKEACDDWKEFLGKPPGNIIGTALKSVVDEFGWDVVRPVWRADCKDASTWTDPGKYNAWIFARSFKAKLAKFRPVRTENFHAPWDGIEESK